MRKVVFPSGLLLSANQRRIYEITSLLPTISGYAPFSLVNAYYYGNMNVITQLNDLEYNSVTGAPHYVRLVMANLSSDAISSDGEHYYFNMYYRKI